MSHVVVIGGGIVGTCCALELLHDGHQVTMLEPGAVGEGASWASCGSIAVSEVIPLSKPGTLKRVPKWLLDPTGPLTLRASSTLFVLPWFLRFLANSRMSRITAISGDISALSLRALSDLQSLLARYGLSGLLRQTPVIELYDHGEELAQERPFHDMRRALGFQIDEISGGEVKALEPAIAGNFACAAVFRDWRSVVDPKRLVVALHKAFVARGGVVEPLGTVGFVREGDQVLGVCTTSGATVRGDQFVIAAGAWSKKLAKALGVKIQLEGVIGYQTMLNSPGVDVTHALIYARGGFGITPYECGLAVAGSIEFASLDAPPNWKRADILVQKAKRVLPELRIQPAEQHMGRRPLTPDTKPIIGRAQGVRNAIFATGHGQLGLTLAATTARHVKDIAGGRASNIDLAAYRPDRF